MSEIASALYIGQCFQHTCWSSIRDRMSSSLKACKIWYHVMPGLMRHTRRLWRETQSSKPCWVRWWSKATVASKTLTWDENGQREPGSVDIVWQAYTVRSESAVIRLHDMGKGYLRREQRGQSSALQHPFFGPLSRSSLSCGQFKPGTRLQHRSTIGMRRS